ncbi:uncharacterized protein LY89DRAFT_786152 [Mollisia scopiformis]|uniref:Fungal N-terminal domain-containing protein n=1 Tax=Mollisia scopiformis TaxID=149040 RepID=A0A194WWF2_MOLSC|nr:uncharacterized protein LY89DRAFT_786152 [Mollisia scopiformis]KUJ12004.1 hypothetical protein LY89DRAFT_786152 [Mollisia scopiformis]
MSFGYAIGDFATLAGIALDIVQNTRKACGAHDNLTREVNKDSRRDELATLAQDCRHVLRVLSQILEKYNALSDEKRSVTKLWQRVRFGNGEMQDLGKIRSELATYTQAITLFLNMLTVGSQGKVEKFMDTQGKDTMELKRSLNWITAKMQASESHEEKSILTSYSEDDKLVWKAFRRELVQEGFSSRSLGRHKDIIKQYILELGTRGLLDETLYPESQTTVESESAELSAEEPSTVSFEHTDFDALDPSSDDTSEATASAIEDNDSDAEVSQQEVKLTTQENSNQDDVLDTEEQEYDSDSSSQSTSSYDGPNIHLNDIQTDVGIVQDDLPSNSLTSQTIQPTEKEAVEGSGNNYSASVEDIKDEDLIQGAHPNCSTEYIHSHTPSPPDRLIHKRPSPEGPDARTSHIPKDRRGESPNRHEEQPELKYDPISDRLPLEDASNFRSEFQGLPKNLNFSHPEMKSVTRRFKNPSKTKNKRTNKNFAKISDKDPSVRSSDPNNSVPKPLAEQVASLVHEFSSLASKHASEQSLETVPRWTEIDAGSWLDPKELPFFEWPLNTSRQLERLLMSQVKQMIDNHLLWLDERLYKITVEDCTIYSFGAELAQEAMKQMMDNRKDMKAIAYTIGSHQSSLIDQEEKSAKIRINRRILDAASYERKADGMYSFALSQPPVSGMIMLEIMNGGLVEKLTQQERERNARARSLFRLYHAFAKKLLVYARYNCDRQLFIFEEVRSLARANLFGKAPGQLLLKFKREKGVWIGDQYFSNDKE